MWNLLKNGVKAFIIIQFVMFALAITSMLLTMIVATEL